MNVVTLMGRLTRDPEIRYTNSNSPVCNISVATNKKYKTTAGEDREQVVYTDWVAFGKMAEALAKHFHKGKVIVANGEVFQDQWEKDGKTMTRLKFYLHHYSFVPTDSPREKPSGQAASAPASKAQEINDADIPF
jgi:single-strand DNA-binding protein